MVWITLICMFILACLLLCFMLVLASLVLGFAMLDALSGFVVVWLHLMPIRPCLDVTICDASPWCRLLRAYLSLTDATFCLLSYLFVFSFVCLLSCFFTCHVYHTYLLYASFIGFLHLFFPLLVCWFLVFAFACTHMEWGHIELGHGLPGTSKKGKDTSM